VQLHELLGERQPEPGPLLLPDVVASDLAELLEDRRLVPGPDPDPGIADGDRDDVFGRRGGEADPPPSGVNFTALERRFSRNACETAGSSASSVEAVQQ
jgi:hypothetical protein